MHFLEFHTSHHPIHCTASFTALSNFFLSLVSVSSSPCWSRPLKIKSMYLLCDSYCSAIIIVSSRMPWPCSTHALRSSPMSKSPDSTRRPSLDTLTSFDLPSWTSKSTNSQLTKAQPGTTRSSRRRKRYCSKCRRGASRRSATTARPTGRGAPARARAALRQIDEQRKSIGTHEDIYIYITGRSLSTRVQTVDEYYDLSAQQ